ncbi:P pilus assembly protein, chaperone PapD [Pseudomonas chlororaphis]|nr:molecular chaperone [Pseudomonas chlororaphis]AZD67414.1 Chaperone protein fimC precursor [Pseudomonas chlororaphis subsp. aurantiaca]PWY37787.1 molecular chaperone [Pseudomonas sp. RW409]MBP5075164.1 molecular chaperone [Pseudomonas chlororaphis]QIT26306.1 molecular chaperone [Pseudomonas chlororaphis subsp. aurantiaca]QTT85702.1 molecular chaperone [Pseudomonas chlororaphis]
MHWLKSVCIAGCLFGITHASWAGVVVGGTRVVYDGSKKEASISVMNPEKTTPYLIQSWIEDVSAGGTQKAPFIMTPPLFRLDAGQENVLRIIRTGGTFPENKESVFWVNIKSIPASEKSDANQLQISVKTRIKLFFRPAGLSGSASEAYKSLKFSRSGNQLQVNNPTPYHVSFYRVSVGKEEITDAGMVAPQSSLAWTIPAGATGAASWQAINDFGGISADASAPL